MNKLLAKLLQRMPRRLPVGLSEFNAFATRIVSISGNFADEDSMRFAIATSLIHADASKGALPDKFFVDRLTKAAANQVASQVFQDVKAKQAAEQQAAIEKQQAEAAATQEVVKDEQKV